MSIGFLQFQEIMNQLFLSFDMRVSTTSFADLSGTAFNWLEEWCTPAHLHQITKTVLSNQTQHPSVNKPQGKLQQFNLM